jgi:hypothetical protein
MNVRTMALIALIVFAVGFATDSKADSDPNQEVAQSSVVNPTDRTSRERRFPIEAPPASEVLPRLRKMTDSRPPVQEKKTSESPQLKMLRRLTGRGAYVALPEPQCFRAAPTRDEFLNMVTNNPADANQILQRCNVDLTGTSPLPQLPVGFRQLPEDTRQRPVQTWGNDYPSASPAPQGSRVQWGLNLKTRRLEHYYSLNNQFGNSSLGLRLGRGKHNLQQYYKIGP